MDEKMSGRKISKMQPCCPFWGIFCFEALEQPSLVSPSLVAMSQAAEAAGMAPEPASHSALPGPNWPVCFAISDSCLSWGGLFFTPLNEVLLY